MSTMKCLDPKSDGVEALCHEIPKGELKSSVTAPSHSHTKRLYRQTISYVLFCSLSELVKHEENGLIFSTSGQLAGQIMVG